MSLRPAIDHPPRILYQILGSPISEIDALSDRAACAPLFRASYRPISSSIGRLATMNDLRENFRRLCLRLQSRNVRPSLLLILRAECKWSEPTASCALRH